MFFRRARIAPRSQELVFLDADDDLGTIRSKLEASSAEEIYLVIPRRSSVMRTPLEFRILARIANEMSSETILVTADPGRRRRVSAPDVGCEPSSTSCCGPASARHVSSYRTGFRCRASSPS